MNYLKDLKLDNPINFLKVINHLKKKSNIGIFVKFIQTKIEDQEINRCADEAYKNFEQQVLEQLFSKKKI